MSIENRAIGLLLGAVFGDVFGLGHELRWPRPSLDWIEELDPRSGCVDECSGRCCYSDDTEMTLIMIRHLFENNCCFDEEGFASLLRDCAEIDNRYRFYGYTTKKIVQGLRYGRKWYEITQTLFGGQGSFGNGAAIRVAPLAIVARSYLELSMMAMRQAMVTHSHVLAIEGSILMSFAQRLTLEGVPPTVLVDRLLEMRRWSDEYRKRLELIEGLLDAKPFIVAEKLGNTSWSHRSVVTAIYIYVKARGDPRKVLSYALSIGGDVDSIASMAMSLSGAFRGPKFFEQYINEVERGEEIRNIIEAFVKQCIFTRKRSSSSRS